MGIQAARCMTDAFGGRSVLTADDDDDDRRQPAAFREFAARGLRVAPNMEGSQQVFKDVTTGLGGDVIPIICGEQSTNA